MDLQKHVTMKNRYLAGGVIGCLVILSLLVGRAFLFKRSPEATVQTFLRAVQEADGRRLYDLSNQQERDLLQLSPSQLTRIVQALHREFPTLKQMKFGEPRILDTIGGVYPGSAINYFFFVPVLDAQGNPLPRLSIQYKLEPDQAGFVVIVHRHRGQHAFLSVSGRLASIATRLCALNSRSWNEVRRPVFADNGLKAMWNGGLVPLSAIKPRAQ